LHAIGRTSSLKNNFFLPSSNLHIGILPLISN
jgi:hypothetical protein